MDTSIDVKNSSILILGLAREGASLARFLDERGARVTVTDTASPEVLAARIRGLPPGVRVVAGGDHPELVADTDRFFVSPGIPETNPVYRAAVGQGLAVESMTTHFFDICSSPILGITGSSGKTTTTALIGHILKTDGRDVVVGGNIGSPMLELLPSISLSTLVVLELSSFQLDLLRRSPHIAVVTNISPNHLDRHETMEKYVAAKRHIVDHQTPHDVCVLNAGDESSREFAASTPAETALFGEDLDIARGATTRNGQVGVIRRGTFYPVIAEADIPLVGKHNLENVLAAVAATSIVDVEPGVMASAIRSFQAPPHRLELVREKAGVRYIDDSIATSPARAAVALRAISSPVLLIAGGRDKHLPWDEFARLAAKKVRALFLIGEAAALIEEAIRPYLASGVGKLTAEHVHRCASLRAAVQAADRLAMPGDVVLLSPACTSYDMFHDFEERAAAFVQAVEALDAA